MQAITTKYFPPTNKRDARVKATAAAGTKMFLWQDEFGPEENHARAAGKFCANLGWNKSAEFKLHTGQLPNGDFCHVMEV